MIQRRRPPTGSLATLERASARQWPLFMTDWLHNTHRHRNDAGEAY